MVEFFTNAFHTIECAGIVELTLATGALLWWGNVVVRSHKWAARTAPLLAWFSFAFFWLYAIVRFANRSPFPLLSVACRSLVCAGLGLAVGQIAFSFAEFVYAEAARPIYRQLAWFGRALGALRRKLTWRRPVVVTPAVTSNAVAISPEEQAKQQKLREREQRKEQKLTVMRSHYEYELRLLYNQLRKQSEEVFPAQEFHELMQTALVPTELRVMNKRVEMLRAAMTCGVDYDDDAPGSIEEIGEQFSKRRQQVSEATTYSDESRETLLRALERAEGKQIERFLKGYT